MMLSPCRISCASIGLLTFMPAILLAAAPRDLATCAAISDNGMRLACYDQLARKSGVESEAREHFAKGKPERDAERSGEREAYSSPVRDIWEIDNDREYQIAAHKPNYVLLRQSSSPNEAPFRQANEFGGSELHFYHNELKYQLSLKSRLGKDPWLGGHVWLGYTQQSLWQIWNAGISRPFRDTNYEPELMWTFPLGNGDRRDSWAPRVLTLGAVHQSNGRGGTLSRSWNRLYAQLGADNGRDFAVFIRPWWRIPARHDDDNPHIERYLGYGDVVGVYSSSTMIASLLLRNNLSLGRNRGAAQLDITFPCVHLGRFALHLQAFSGYGETLIDYDHKQTSIGLGLSASEWTHRGARRCGG